MECQGCNAYYRRNYCDFYSQNGLKFTLADGLSHEIFPIQQCIWAHAQRQLTLISILVAIEQLGCFFGLPVYLLYMMMISEGENNKHTTLYTGTMAFRKMISGMFSGAIQESFGCRYFFYCNDLN